MSLRRKPLLTKSPALNLIEMLWHDLKQAAHALINKPSNLSESKPFFKEDWA